MADLEINTSLGVALTEIEKKVGQAEVDRDSFKKNLSNKGVNVSGLNKMGELINSIPSIEVKKIASGKIDDINIRGNGYWIDTTYNYSLDFTPSILIVKFGNTEIDKYQSKGSSDIALVATKGNNILPNNTNNCNIIFYSKDPYAFDVSVSVSRFSQSSFTLSILVNATIVLSNVNWIAIG